MDEMPSRRPIRFAIQVNPEPDAIDRVGAEAEAAGFDVISVADHIGAGLGAPMITLARLAGAHYRVSGAKLAELDSPPPILVGGNGTALLEHAARHADIIGLQGLGRTLADGHQHMVRFGIDHLEAQLAVIAAAAENHGRAVMPELNALIQFCNITDDRRQALADLVDGIEGLTMDDAAATPYVAVGTVEEIATQMIAARDRWCISYFTTHSMDLAPVIARVRELEAADLDGGFGGR